MRVLMIGGDKNVLNPSTAAGKRIMEYRQILGELYVIVAAGGLAALIKAFLKGFVLLRLKRFDVITAQSPEHWLVAKILSGLFNVAWQAQVHTDIFSPYFRHQSFKNKIRFFLAKKILPTADGIRVVSERIKNSIVENCQLKIASSDIEVLPIFVDIEKFKNAAPNNEYPGEFLILTVARLEPEKNLQLAVDAVADVICRNSAKKIRYVIIGEGSQRKDLESRIMNYGLNDRIIIKQIDHSDLPGWYKRADLFLLTSNYEGYGMAAVEAAAAGTPIVMTNVGLALGKTVSVGDKQALIEAITEHISGIRNHKSEKILSSLTKQEYLKRYKSSLEKLFKTDSNLYKL